MIMNITTIKTSGTLRALGLALALGALPLLLGVSGCTTSDNRYEQTTGEYIDDRALTDEVRRSLSNDPEYKFTDVNVTVFKSVVQLSGFTATSAQKTRAGERAKAVLGVKEVKNNITIKG